MLKMRGISTIILLISAFALQPIPPVEAAPSPSRCLEGFGGGLTNDCRLPNADNEEIINAVNTCTRPSGYKEIGDLSEPGHDFLLMTNFIGLGVSGKVSAPTTIYVTSTLSLRCRGWAGAYNVTGKIIAPNGATFNINFGSGDFRKRDQELNTSHYCFLDFDSMCGFSRFRGSVDLPSDAVTGLYKVQMTVSAAGSEASRISPVTETFSNILDVTGVPFSAPSPTPTVTPTPTPTPTQDPSSIPTTSNTIVENSDGGILCSSPDFTSEAVKAYSIIGTRFRITMDNGSGVVPLDEYDWGLGVQPNGDSIREYTTNGGKISLLVDGKTVVYGYVVKNQIKGATYQCSIAVRTSYGTGRYNTQFAKASFSTVNFTRILDTATQTPTPTATTSANPFASAADKAAADKIIADATAAASKIIADAKAAVNKAAAVAKAAAKKKTTITCIKGKLTKKITAVKPKCPAGYKKK